MISGTSWPTRAGGWTRPSNWSGVPWSWTAPAGRPADDDEENAAYLDSLGWVLFRRGHPAEAREWLAKAAALPEGAGDPTVWDHLGDAEYRLGAAGRAAEAWRKARSLYATEKRSKGDPRADEVRRKLEKLAPPSR